MVQAEVDPLRALMPNLERFDQAREQLFQQHPDQPVFDSLPGPGPALAPRLLAALGSDRDRYQDAAEIQCFSGVAPVTERSGKTPWVQWRWACPKFVRQSFHEFAAQSRFHSAWAKASYQPLRLRGGSPQAAVRALAFKWIRIIYRCWKDRTPYDERIYLQALQRHGSPLMAALALWPPQEARA